MRKPSHRQLDMRSTLDAIPGIDISLKRLFRRYSGGPQALPKEVQAAYDAMSYLVGHQGAHEKSLLTEAFQGQIQQSLHQLNQSIKWSRRQTRNRTNGTSRRAFLLSALAIVSMTAGILPFAVTIFPALLSVVPVTLPTSSPMILGLLAGAFILTAMASAVMIQRSIKDLKLMKRELKDHDALLDKVRSCHDKVRVLFEDMQASHSSSSSVSAASLSPTDGVSAEGQAVSGNPRSARGKLPEAPALLSELSYDDDELDEEDKASRSQSLGGVTRDSQSGGSRAASSGTPAPGAAGEG